MELAIRTTSRVDATGLYKNGKLLYKNSEALPFSAYGKEAYRYLNPAYAKFFKMDELCKLAFLAAEILLSGEELQDKGEEGAHVAIILGNRNSSLVTDLAHYQTYQDSENYFPSPAVFVYTLPNIMLGEICIRHQISGENSCFLMEEPQAAFLHRYVQELFENEGYQYCITGWVDYGPEHYAANLFLVEKAAAGKSQLRKFDEHFISKASV